MTMAWNYSNTSVETTLSAGIGPADTAIALVSTVGLPVSFPYTLVVDHGEANLEVVTVTGLSGSNLTITRGQDGTTAQSHNAGAVVVHGVVARDLREPQQHIDASSNVHGVGASSSVVGTATTQTLTNKSISGASNTLSDVPASAVTGTFNDVVVEGSTSIAIPLVVQGHPAQNADIFVVKDGAGSELVRVSFFGGLDVVGGGGTFGAGVHARSTSETDQAFTVAASADSFGRMVVLANGVVTFGSGSGLGDTNLYRSAADTLRTDDSLSVGTNLSVTGFVDVTDRVRATRALVADNSLEAAITGDTIARLAVKGDGKVEWGPGGAATRDTNLYRSAADTLKTDDSLTVAGTLTAGTNNVNDVFGAWTSYTPAWTGSVSNPVIGNGSLVGKFKQIGKTVHYRITVTMGSTTTYGSGFYSFTLPVTAVAGQVATAHIRDSSAGAEFACTARMDTTQIVRMHAGNGSQVTNTTFPWDANDVILVSGTYEAA